MSTLSTELAGNADPAREGSDLAKCFILSLDITNRMQMQEPRCRRALSIHCSTGHGNAFLLTWWNLLPDQDITSAEQTLPRAEGTKVLAHKSQAVLAFIPDNRYRQCRTAQAENKHLKTQAHQTAKESEGTHRWSTQINKIDNSQCHQDLRKKVIYIFMYHLWLVCFMSRCVACINMTWFTQHVFRSE